MRRDRLRINAAARFNSQRADYTTGVDSRTQADYTTAVDSRTHPKLHRPGPDPAPRKLGGSLVRVALGLTSFRSAQARSASCWLLGSDAKWRHGFEESFELRLSGRPPDFLYCSRYNERYC
jgi:hypothetical protein